MNIIGQNRKKINLEKILFCNSFIMICLVLSLFVIQGCNIGAKHPALVDANLPEMIRIKELFFDIKPESCFKVSPDGKKIAWLGERRKKTTIFFKTIGKNDTKCLNHNFAKSTIHFNRFYWAQDSRHILYPIWEEFFGQVHIYAADTQNHIKVAKDLTPDKNNSYQIHQILKNDPMHIILQKYGISETITKTSTIDLVKLNIITAKTQKLSQNPGDVYSWITDRNGNLKARIVLTDLIKRSLEIQGSTADIWNPILTWTIDDSVKFLGFSPEYKSLYLFSNVGRDRIGLIEMDIKTQKQKLIVDDPTSDMENIVISHVSNKPIAAAAYPDYQKKYLLDSSYADLFEAFNSNEKKSINIISKDNQERLATLTVMTSTNVSWFLYNRDTKEKELLATRFSPEYSKKLSIMKPISYKSRDGLLINGYLTLPTGTSGKSLPMVLYVHGGPWSRDYWGLSPTVQLLSNRGYAVLQINFRGSSGYGRAFMEAGKGEFAGKMHTDLIDGVDWVVGQGIADPDKIAILGQSYGGYASLVGLAFTPDVFACGVDVNGIANLETFLKSKDVKNDDYKIWYKWQTYVGDPENPEDLETLKAKSPFFHVDKINKPLLIVQGAKDKRVPRSEADAMVKALKSNNKEVKYILFPKESHYILWWSNRFRMINNIENFFGEHLGGRRILTDSI